MAELADEIGVAKTGFLQTIASFNQATRPGTFDPFKLDGLGTGDRLQIPKSNWAQPLDKPPYVAYGVTCGEFHCRDQQSYIVNAKASQESHSLMLV